MFHDASGCFIIVSVYKIQYYRSVISGLSMQKFRLEGERLRAERGDQRGPLAKGEECEENLRGTRLHEDQLRWIQGAGNHVPRLRDTEKASHRFLQRVQHTT